MAVTELPVVFNTKGLGTKPYSSVDELPANIRKKPAKQQRQWMAVFNSVYKESGDEGKAFASANAAIKPKKDEKD